MIKAIIFDLGGVLVDLDYDACVKKFKELLGFDRITEILDKSHQKGIFGDMEEGKIFIPSQTVVKQLSNIVVRDIKNYSFDRTAAKDEKRLVHIRTKGLSFPVGILSSFDSVKDKNLRMASRRVLMHKELCNGYGPFVNPRDVFRNYFQGHNMPFYMLVEFMKKCRLYQ